MPTSTILIIGAGMSGIASARRLIDQGFRVVVLEARDRIGGRIWTDHSLGLPIDLGASWIHCSDGNPITELASEFELPTSLTRYDRNIVFDASGELVGEKAERILLRLQQLADELEEDISLSSGIDLVVGELGPLSAPEQRYLNKCLSEFQVINGAELHEQSLWSLTKFAAAIQESERLFPRGYIEVAEKVAEGISIVFNEPVIRISQSESAVKVETRSREYDGDAVIVTLPLGVLQSGSVAFSPPLPNDKQQAISSLKMGVMNKVIVRFSRVFWPPGRDFIEFTQTAPGPFHSFLNYFKICGEPVLIGFGGGNLAAALEDKSDEDIAAEVMRVLRVLPDADGVELTGLTVTRWAADQFAMGSYSVVPIGCSSAFFSALAKPFGRLFFAGEATALENQGTVHGAYLSGIRAAEEVAAAWRTGGPPGPPP